MRWIIALSLFLVLGCDPVVDSIPDDSDPAFDTAAKGPVNSRGNKEVVEIDDYWLEYCDDGEVLFHVRGWYQTTNASGHGHTDDLTIYHIEVSYTNPDGNDVVLWHDVGPDHFYYNQDGDLMWSVTGRSTATYVNGHVVFNVTQGEIGVFSAGRDFDLCDYR